MVRNIDFREKRILFIAIAASIALHLFWISAIRIQASPSQRPPVRFSSVSFLGPVSEKGLFELKAAPKEASFLEDRQRRMISAALSINFKSSGAPRGGPEDKKSEDRLKNGPLTQMIEKAIDTAKTEPDFPADVE